MGIYLDTVEDNDESIGWRVEDIRRKLGIPQLPSREFAYFPCIICDRFFFKETELNDHIFNNHRSEYSNTNHFHYTNNSRHKLTPDQFIEFDKQIIHLQELVDRNDRTTIDKLWLNIHDLTESCSSIQKQYLEGLLEYLKAHDLEVNKNQCDKIYHFETAYGKLERFPTILAQQTRRAIAFKMNWFKEHEDVPVSSIFSLIWHFFTHEYEDVIKINNLIISGERYSQGIIIDNFHLEVIEAVQKYYCTRTNILNHEYLNKLELLTESLKNRNYLDKISLLKARLYRECNNFEKARISYRNIRSHPSFSSEAETFLSTF